MFGRKYWAESLLSEVSAQKEWAEGSAQFPFSRLFSDNRLFFKQKMHGRFRLLALKLALPKQSEAKAFLRVRILNPKSDDWGKFARTFSQFTINMFQNW
jgi:hypothetical protein